VPPKDAGSEQVNRVAIVGDANQVQQYIVNIYNTPNVSTENQGVAANPKTRSASQSGGASAPARRIASGGENAGQSSAPVAPSQYSLARGVRGKAIPHDTGGIHADGDNPSVPTQRNGLVGKAGYRDEYPEGDLRNPLRYAGGPGADAVWLRSQRNWEIGEAYIDPETELPTRSFSSSEGRVRFLQKENGALNVIFSGLDNNGEHYTAIETHTDDAGFNGLRYGRTDTNDKQVVTHVWAEDDGDLSSLAQPWIGKDYHNNNLIAKTDVWETTTATGIDEVTRAEIQNFFANRPMLQAMVNISEYPVAHVQGQPISLGVLMNTEARYQIRYDAIDQPAAPEGGYVPNTGERDSKLLDERTPNRGPGAG